MTEPECSAFPSWYKQETVTTWTIVNLDDPEYPPDEIFKAAKLVSDYFERNGTGYWAIGNVCSRFHKEPPNTP